MLDEFNKAIKVWISLKCIHCGRLNPLDVTRRIYCMRSVRK